VPLRRARVNFRVDEFYGIFSSANGLAAMRMFECHFFRRSSRSWDDFLMATFHRQFLRRKIPYNCLMYMAIIENA
jgi:hypothetical protein